MTTTIRTIRTNLGKPVWTTENHSSDASQERRLWEKIVEETGHPLLIHFLSKLIEVGNIPARDPEKLARALQLYSARRIKFFRERPERFQSPLRTLVWGLGDCDDKTIFLASALRSFRIPVRVKFIRIKLSPSRVLGHVYPLVLIGGKWVPLESVREYPWGYDPEEKAKSKGFEVSSRVLGDPPDTLHA